jgi:hypothetical protein
MLQIYKFCAKLPNKNETIFNQDIKKKESQRIDISPAFSNQKQY